MNKTRLVLLLIPIALMSGCSREAEVEPTPEETVLLAVGDTAPGFEKMVEIIEQAINAIGVTHGPQSPDIPELPVETKAV